MLSVQSTFVGPTALSTNSQCVSEIWDPGGRNGTAGRKLLDWKPTVNQPQRYRTVKVVVPEIWVNVESTITFIDAWITAEACPVPPVTV